MTVETNGRRITRDDLQAAFSKVMGEGEQTARAAAPQALFIAGAVALGVLAVVYLFGRRGGRKRSAVLEIRQL
ncbi:MAG TPA: hypothetical protein VN781_09580 [Acidimicrobiales bacterium]|nr:hypothetical protein [Acidimicrobiales bacterium]